jgi:mono/diheme cytochrome c family protein
MRDGPRATSILNDRRSLMMKSMAKAAVAACWVVSCGAALAQAAQPLRTDFGKREFESKCAVCHGLNGKGQGPVVDLLKKAPPDLTLLAKRNSGVFPMERLYQVIDASDIPAHGTRDMPIWGRDYRIQAGEYYMDVPYDPNTYVRARILALLEYINRLQVK